jgi:hypothetical protein
VPRQASGSISVRVELPSYRGARLQKTIAVPVATPEVVLVSPYADGTIPAGTASFTALPYFFNVARIGELVFSWVVNGTPAGGSVAAPNLLSLDVSGAEAGNAVLLAVTAENPVKGIEVGRASTQLTVR